MKRTSEHQLTKDNAGDADAESAATGPQAQAGFQRASAEVLATRRILKVRRTPNLRPAPAAAPAANPFAKLARPAARDGKDEAEAAKPADLNTAHPLVEAKEAAPAEAKPAEAKPAEPEPEEPKSEEPKSEDSKPEDSKLPEPELADQKPADQKPPAEDAAPVPGNTTTEPPAAASPAAASPASTTPADAANHAPAAEPPLSAPNPTPAPLKPLSAPPNGRPKPAIIFGAGATTHPLSFASAAQKDGFNFKSAEAAPVVEEKKPEFKEAHVMTGEEHERELYRTRAKLYALETAADAPRWKERAVGALKLNKDTRSGKARLLMRTEATLRVVLNTHVFNAFQIDRAADKSVRFQGSDVDDQQTRTSFLARFCTKEVTDEFIAAVEECKKDLE